MVRSGRKSQRERLVAGACDDLIRGLRTALLEVLKSFEVLEPHDRGGVIDFNKEVEQFEIDLIRVALIRTGGHQTRASQLLGIKLSTLNSKMARYKIHYTRSGECRAESQEEESA